MGYTGSILLALIAFSTACEQQNVKEPPIELAISVSTPSEEKLKRKKDIEDRMLKGEYLHDGSLDLQGIGDINSVPALLKVLEEYRPNEKGVTPCTASHALDTLKIITGANPGITFEAWERWWRKNQPRKL